MNIELKTSNFANNRIYNLQGISISRFPDKRSGFSGPEFPPLMPNEKLLKEYKEGLEWDDYKLIYRLQLECLDPQKTYKRLIEISKACGGGETAIILCYESAKTLNDVPCHRRLVAQWFEHNLNVSVPEWKKS